MASKLLLLVLISSSCFTMGKCQDPEAPPPCMKSLVPCKPYLHEDETPPSECCVPLKQVMKTDMDCLCEIFNNPQVLAGFNLTHEQAMKLPTHCDKNADLSTCDGMGASTPGSAPESLSDSASSSSPTSSSSSSSAGNATANTTPMGSTSGADKMMSQIQLGGLGLVGVMMTMMMI